MYFFKCDYKCRSLQLVRQQPIIWFLVSNPDGVGFVPLLLFEIFPWLYWLHYFEALSWKYADKFPPFYFLYTYTPPQLDWLLGNVSLWINPTYIHLNSNKVMRVAAALFFLSSLVTDLKLAFSVHYIVPTMHFVNYTPGTFNWGLDVFSIYYPRVHADTTICTNCMKKSDVWIKKKKQNDCIWPFLTYKKKTAATYSCLETKLLVLKFCSV